ncbi:MAG: hypothetical protein P8144_06070 [Gammaproteobacteria bacterium]
MSAIDAIIVLGNLMSAEGRLNIESSSRAAYAAGIYHQLGGVPIITCGWRYRSDTSLSLAQAMQNCLHHTHGVATSLVFGHAFHLYFDSTPSSHSDSQTSKSKEEASRQSFRQTFQGVPPGDDAKIFTRLQCKHPYYNGAVHPKIFPKACPIIRNPLTRK